MMKCLMPAKKTKYGIHENAAQARNPCAIFKFFQYKSFNVETPVAIQFKSHPVAKIKMAISTGVIGVSSLSRPAACW